MKQLPSALFVAAVIITMAFVTHKDTSIPHTPLDTVPKYKYYLRIDMAPQQVIRALISMDSIMDNYGQDMLNSASEKAKRLHSGYIQSIWSNVRMDSVLVSDTAKKKGGKK